MSDPTDAVAPRRLWQVAGGLAIAHLALMLAGFTLTPVSRLGDATGTVVATYRSSSLAAAAIGTAVSVLGFLAFFLAVPLFARLLRGDREVTRWLSTVITTAGAAYVGLTLALPFAVSSAARYGAHHGMPASTVAALSNLHWFGVFLSTAVLGLFTVALAAGVWVSHLLPRWVALGGFVAGAVCLSAAAEPPENLLDDGTLVWMVWFAALAIASLRAARVPSRQVATAVAA